MTQNIIKAILEITIYSSILIVAVMSIRAMFGTKLNTRIVSFLWILVLCRLLLPITIPASINLDDIVSPKIEQVKSTTIPKTLELPANHEILSTLSTESIQTNYIPKAVSPSSIPKPVDVAIKEPTPKPKAINIVPFIIRHRWNLLFALWLLGSTRVLGIHQYRTITFSRKINRCRQCRSKKVLSIIQNHSDLLKIRIRIRVVSCPDVSIPVVYGIVRPTILLPLHIEKSINESKLRCILLHEMCHIKHGDMAKNYLWLLVKSLYWFNPLVWFAYQNYLDDVEISCDEMVLGFLNSEEKFEYTGSLIDVIRISQYGYKLPLTVSFCKNKSKIRKRVTNMLDPKSKSKKANLLAIILALALIIGCFTTACQLTPEKSVVQSKKDDFIKKVLESTKEQETSTNEPTPTPLPQKEDQKVIEQEVIDHIDGKLTLNKRVKININADVYMPENVNIPLARIEPTNFTKEQFNSFIKYFAGDEPVYYSQDPNIYAWLNKEEIEVALLELKSCLTNENLEEYIINNIKNNIQWFEKKYNKALSKEDNKLYNGELVKIENNKYYSTLTELKSFLGHNIAARFHLSQSFNNTSSQMTFQNYNYNELYNNWEPYTGIPADKIKYSYDEAKKIAIDVVKAIDGKDTNLSLSRSSICYQIGTFKGYTKETSPQAYSFLFNRNYNGMNAKHVNYLSGVNENVNYSQRIRTEGLSIVIDDTGIIYCSWRNYSKFNEIIADNVELLNFNNVRDIYINQLVNKFTWVPQGDLIPKDLKATIDIKRVELNLMTTAEKNNIEDYLIVPVWDFIGDVTYDQTIKDGGGYTCSPPENVSIITINAIDGTVISREQGY